MMTPSFASLGASAQRLERLDPRHASSSHTSLSSTRRSLAIPGSSIARILNLSRGAVFAGATGSATSPCGPPASTLEQQGLGLIETPLRRAHGVAMQLLQRPQSLEPVDFDATARASCAYASSPTSRLAPLVLAHPTRMRYPRSGGSRWTSSASKLACPQPRDYLGPRRCASLVALFFFNSRLGEVDLDSSDRARRAQVDHFWRAAPGHFSQPSRRWRLGRVGAPVRCARRLVARHS